MPLTATPNPNRKYPRGYCLCRMDRTLEETCLANERGWRLALHCLDRVNNDDRVKGEEMADMMAMFVFVCM